MGAVRREVGVEPDPVLLHPPFLLLPFVVVDGGETGDEAGRRSGGLQRRTGRGIEHQDIQAALGQVMGGQATEGAGADDDDVGPTPAVVRFHSDHRSLTFNPNLLHYHPGLGFEVV